MKQSKHTATLSTRGFYTILTICSVIIAISIWVLWSSARRAAKPALDTPSVITPVDSSDRLDTPVSAEVPETSENPEESEGADGQSEQTVSKPDNDVPVSAASPESIQTEPYMPEAIQSSAPVQSAEEAPTVITSAPVYVRPVSGAVVTPFSGDELLFQATFGDWRVHNGTDFLAEPGETVLALTAGTVSDVFEDGLYGTCVSIVHDADLTSTYRGLSDVRVSAGQAVNAGEALGVCAETIDAEAALGTHIHVEAARAGTPVNVLELLNEEESE